MPAICTTAVSRMIWPARTGAPVLKLVVRTHTSIVFVKAVAMGSVPVYVQRILATGITLPGMTSEPEKVRANAMMVHGPDGYGHTSSFTEVIPAGTVV